MRIWIIALWLVVCVCIYGLVAINKKYSIYLKIGVLILVWGICIFGSKFINLRFLELDARDKIKQVSEICGETYIQEKDGVIFVLINNEWVDVSKIKIIGSLTKDITIEYEGRVIYLGHSGVVNTIKTLKSIGVIK